MTTIAAAIKEGVVAIAADTLITGSSMASQEYLKAHDKIVAVNGSYVGFTGYSASILVAEHLILTEPDKFKLSNRFEIFTTLLRLQKILKDDYFINAAVEQDKNPTELNQLNLLIANDQGVFIADENRDVQSFTKFWSLGSGSYYALGAMDAIYDNAEVSAVDLVSKAIEVASKFDSSTGLPLQQYSLEYKPDPAKQSATLTRMEIKLQEKKEELEIETLVDKAKKMLGDVMRNA